LGGGYYDVGIREGFYRIEARSNFAIWLDYGAARETWRKRATVLCGSAEYTELAMSESVTGFVRGLPGGKAPLAMVNGYALCKSSPISVPEALAIIKD
jgi:hypothetical protein